MRSLAGNAPAIVGLFLLAVPVVAWVLILLKQYEFSKPKTYRVNVLLARTSLFLPLYAVFVWAALADPEVYEGMQILFSIVEGYSFYSMFAMIVANLGGPANAVRTMRAANRAPYCTSCCPTEPATFYSKVLGALWYFFFIRVVFIIIATIGYYKHLQKVYLVFTLLGLGFLIYALVSLISFYENLLHLKMGHVWKMVTLKVAIGIIVIEGLIEEFLYMGGAFDNTPTSSGYTHEGTVIRYFCLIVLIQYVFFALAVWGVYSTPVAYTDFTDPAQDADGAFGALDNHDRGATAVTSSASFSHPGSHIHHANTGTMSKGSPSQHEGGGSVGASSHKESFFTFVHDVFRLTDLWYAHDLKFYDGGLNAPLMAGQSGGNSQAGSHL